MQNKTMKAYCFAKYYSQTHECMFTRLGEILRFFGGGFLPDCQL